MKFIYTSLAAVLIIASSGCKAKGEEAPALNTAELSASTETLVAPTLTPDESANVTLSTSTTLVRRDGLWVQIVIQCYPGGIETQRTCAQSTADYQRIIATMRAAGFRYNENAWKEMSGENNVFMTMDIAYRISISPNMGGGLSYSVDTPHPGLNAQMSNSMPVENLDQLPKNLADLHRSFQVAMNSMDGEDADMVKINTNP